MNIFISNDDGIKSDRIKMLRKVLNNYGTTYLSAPKNEHSGASCSLSLPSIGKINKIDDYTIFLDGTPADASIYGLNYFGNVKFDLFVSGINYGYNLSRDSMYSGTVGAGLIGAFTGIKTIMLSAEVDDDLYSIKEKTEYILDFIFKNKLLDEFPFLNVNYPVCSLKETIGVKVGKIYSVSALETYDRTQYMNTSINEESDRYLVKNNYFSITPFKPSYEDEIASQKLKRIIEK